MHILSRLVVHDNVTRRHNILLCDQAEAWMRYKKRPTQPVCSMSAGYVAGWCQESYGMELVTKGKFHINSLNCG